MGYMRTESNSTVDIPKGNSEDLVTSAVAKEAGITVYLMEELTDARLRCEQLKRFVAQAVRLISKSPHKDHFYEVAGDVIYGIPDSLFKLDKALSSTALAASRLDYEELKSQLRPEKVLELEDALRDVRIRQIERKAPLVQPVESPDKKDTPKKDTPKKDTPKKDTPKEKTAMYKAASQSHIAGALRRIASEVEKGTLHPKQARLRLSRVMMALSQTAQEAIQAMGDIPANSRKEVMDGFKSANPDLTDEHLKEIADHWDKHKNNLKKA